MPKAEIARALVEAGIGVVDFFAAAQPGTTKSDNRRLVEQGGASVNGNVIKDVHTVITLKDADKDGEFILKAGKKKVIRVVLK